MTTNLENRIKFMDDLLDLMPVEVAMRDAEGRYTLVNSAWERSSGLQRGQVLGKTAFELFPQQRAQSIADSDRAALALGGKTLYSDFQVRGADDGYRYLAVSKTAMLDAEGKVVGLLSTATDVTGRREAEQALKDQVKLTRDLIDANPMPIYLKDTELRYQEANPAFVAHTGWALDGLIGRTAYDVIPFERARLYEKMERALLERGEGSDTIEIELPRPGGLRHYLMTKSVLRRSDGTVRGLVCTIAEVTPLKRVEAELRASREEALQAARAKAAFLATMSHEIRTPLNGVIGMTGILRDTALTAEQRDYVETIRLSGETLLAVINDILDFSKIDSGKLELEREPLEIARVIEQAFDILGERARAKRLELLYQIEDDVPPRVYGDATYLRQIVVNLVGNAVKFTDAGEVLVVVRPQAAGPALLEFGVSDTGVGIPPDRLASLFEPFTQVDASTTRKYGGTGLGLAICKRLTELMGGTIAVSSEPGRGSTFTFAIRCEPAPAMAAADAAPGHGELAGKAILIVDDNASNLRILEHQLARWGMRPRPAESGRAALALLAGGARFDAAVVDYHMPGMDGVELAQAMKKHPGGAGLPVILLSSALYRRGKGAHLFAVQLLKPTRQSQLFDALVTALTARRAAGRAAPARATTVPRLARELPLGVLVVDDNDVNRRIAVLLLGRFGYKADMAVGGRQALAAVERHRYDIVFMDVQMPEMDGYEATRAIKAALGSASPAIVAMTANAMEGDREACLAAGMSDYLSKPIGMAALQAVLERWGRRGRQPPTTRAPGADAAGGTDTAPNVVDRSRLDEIGKFDNPRRTVVRKLIGLFIADGKTRTQAIARAAASRDASRLALAAHALKGAALNVGASALAAACARVENLARNGSVAEVNPLVASLKQRFSEAASALAREVQTSGTRRSAPRAAPKRNAARRKAR